MDQRLILRGSNTNVFVAKTSVLLFSDTNVSNSTLRESRNKQKVRMPNVIIAFV
jgi:hypothetical protein